MPGTDPHELSRLANILNCSDSIQDMAHVIYRRVHEEDLQPGRSAETVSASALYAAARLENQPHDLREIAAAAQSEQTQIGRSYKDLTQSLDLDPQVVNPAEFVPRFCSTLGVSDHLRSLAHEIVDLSFDTGLVSGRAPAGIAASAVYFAGRLVAGEDAPNQDDIADVAEVAPVTIRNHLRDQEDLLGIERNRAQSQLSIYESPGISAEQFNEEASRFEIIQTEPNLFESRARCCRCGHSDVYRYLLQNHQPERFGGTQLCYEEYFSAADLADQLNRFEAIEREVDFGDTYLKCSHCGETGPYREMMDQHHTKQLARGGPHICYEYEGGRDRPTGTEVAEQVEHLETKDAEFEIVEPRADLNDLRIRCIHCGAEGRYRDLAWEHRTHWYSHKDDPTCSDRSW